MEDFKYYTPELSEFHAGFNYEMKSCFGDGTVKTREQYDNANWEKITFSINEFPYLERTMTGTNSKNLPSAIRVKHLDKEDLESLGWKFELDEVDHYKVNNFKLYYFDEGRVISIDKYYTTENNYKKTSQVFRGIINNKSELKKLMQQLGING